MDNKWKIYYKMDDATLKEAIELDKEAFEDIDTVTFEHCKSWLKRNDENYTVLKYDGELVGYTNFVPLTDECYNRYREGIGKDYFLQSNDILPFQKGKNNKCLMLSIVIKKKFRDGDAIKILWGALKERINNFKKQGIHITHIIQDCVSMDGIKVALNFFNARYVCDSLGGKIYEAKLDEEKSINVPKLRYETINSNNIKLIGKIQYDIFKDANGVGYSDYLEELKYEDSPLEKRLPINFLVYHDNVPVGIVGLYEMPGYKDDIWLNWLGVLPEHRRKGIGTAMLFHVINLAKKYGKKNFRLFSYENWHKQAISIYKKTMQVQESYLNKEDDLRLIIEGRCKIFSCSLVDKRPPLWNNEFIDLTGEEKLHRKSIEALINDGVIEEKEEVFV